MPEACRIHHVAVVVDDLDDALGFWGQALGLKVSRVEDLPNQQSTIAFLPTDQGEIELVRPTTEESGISRFLKKRGPGIHHLCLEVADFDARLQRLRDAGVRLITPEPTIGPGGRRMIFIHPDSAYGVLVELYEAGLDEVAIRLDRSRNPLGRIQDQGKILAAGVRALWRSLRGAESKDI